MLNASEAVAKTPFVAGGSTGWDDLLGALRGCQSQRNTGILDSVIAPLGIRSEETILKEGKTGHT